MTRPADPRLRLGLRGEAEAERVLRDAGLRIVARRFRVRSGEIDLIAFDDDVLVFVEVKTRRGTGYGRPSEAVDRAKRRRIARVAQTFITRNGLDERRCRFDVVEVLGGAGGTARVRHIRDAFRLWPGG